MSTSGLKLPTRTEAEVRAARQRMPLWKVEGTSTAGNPVKLKLRAMDHGEAVGRAKQRGIMPTSVVLCGGDA